MSDFMKGVRARCEEHLAEDEAEAKARQEMRERGQALMAELRAYLDTPDARAAGFTFQYHPLNDPVRVYAHHSDQQVFGITTEFGLLIIFTDGGSAFSSLEEAKPRLIELASDWLRDVRDSKEQARERP